MRLDLLLLLGVLVTHLCERFTFYAGSLFLAVLHKLLLLLLSLSTFLIKLCFQLALFVALTTEKLLALQCDPHEGFLKGFKVDVLR